MDVKVQKVNGLNFDAFYSEYLKVERENKHFVSHKFVQHKY